MADCLVGQLMNFESPAKQVETNVKAEQENMEQSEEPCQTTDESSEQSEDTQSQLKSCQDLSIEESRADSSLSNEKLLFPGTLLKEDIKLIDQEEFDFDLPVSPSSEKELEDSKEEISNRKEDEEEVFFGPMGYSEQLAAKVVEEEEKTADIYKPLSPLSAEEMVKLFHEAQLVAHHISTARNASSSSEEGSKAVKSFTFGAGKSSTGDSPLGVPLDSQGSTATPRRRTRKNTFTFDSPLDTLSKNLGKALPEVKSNENEESVKGTMAVPKLQFDSEENVQIKFTACGKPPSGDSNGGSLKKCSRTPGSGSKMSHRRSGRTPGSGQKHQQRKSNLVRPGGLRPPQTRTNTEKGNSSQLLVQKRRSISPQSLKRRRIGSNESVDDENMSMMSEESETCPVSVPSGTKRTLPQPRSKISRVSTGMAPPGSSRLAVPSRGNHKRTNSNSSTSSTCSNVSTQSASSAQESRITGPKSGSSLRRSNSASKIALPSSSTAGTSKLPPAGGGSRLQRQGSLRRPNTNGASGLTKPTPINKQPSGNNKPPSPKSAATQSRLQVRNASAAAGSKPVNSNASAAAGSKPVNSNASAAAGSKPVNSRLSFNSAAGANSNNKSSGESNSQQASNQPVIKGQMTKLQLLKPGALQRRTLSVNRSMLGQNCNKNASGPLKAVNVVKNNNTEPAGRSADSTGQLKKPGDRVGTPVKPKEGSQGGRRPAQSHIQTTPVKPEKNVQPRKLMQPSPAKSTVAVTPKKSSTSTTPRKNSDSGLSTSSTPVMAGNKRRSFLPTPKSCRSMSMGSNTSMVSDRSSVSSMDSDLQMSSVGKSPAVGVLIDLNGLDPNSPSCLKPRQAKVMHTPVGGNKENRQKPLSLWSPRKTSKAMQSRGRIFPVHKENIPARTLLSLPELTSTSCVPFNMDK